MTVTLAEFRFVTLPSHPPEPAEAADDPRWADRRAVLERALARLASRVSGPERDDLVQEGMVRLVRQSGEVNHSYIWKVAWSVVQDAKRRRRRKPEDGPEALHTAVDHGPDPARLAESAQVREALQGCLEAAPAARREFLTLYLLGHPPSECAQLLDATKKKAENAIYRGLSALRECLAAKGVEQ